MQSRALQSPVSQPWWQRSRAKAVRVAFRLPLPPPPSRNAQVLEALDSCTGTLQEMMSDLQESAFRSVADDAGLRGPGPACSSRNALRVRRGARSDRLCNADLVNLHWRLS